MTPRLAFLVAILALVGPPATAQHAAHQHHGAHAPASSPIDPARPYAGLQQRGIKSLSAEQISDLRSGRGMGLALAAELNGYPGPMHVLEHAEALGLTPAQRAAAEALRDRMGAEARTIGDEIIRMERELDALFAGGSADAGRLAALTAALGAMNGRLREVHLATHIEMRAALDATQRAAYARLRGYSGP